MLSRTGASQVFKVYPASRALTSRVKARTLVSQSVRKPTVAALGFFRKKIATSGAVDDILSTVSDTERGCRTSRSQRASIDAALGVLEGAGDSGAPISKGLSATWRLLWTTEKIIDTEASTLQNIIAFPPDGAFTIQSKIEVSGSNRVTFEFLDAKLKLPRRDLKLPPIGKGWFDTVYLDSRIRVSKDSRGDTLIVARDGPPREVT